MIKRKPIITILCVLFLVYFLIILVLSRPLQKYHSFPFVEEVKLKWCSDLRWHIPPRSNIVALVSFPGSGNTWVRYLLQQTTGILTGSIYIDHELKDHGFPAEFVSNGSVLVVKTHENPPLDNHTFHMAILLIRNPKDALLADFHRLHGGHMGVAPEKIFKYDMGFPRWSVYVPQYLKNWEMLYRNWVELFQGRWLLVHFEDLLINTRSELKRILEFINHTVTEEALDCAISLKEGIYKRTKKNLTVDPFTSYMTAYFELVKDNLFHFIKDYRKIHYNYST